MAPKKVALIPAYEPDGNLLYLTEALCKKGYAVVIVDDGSDPFYRSLFEKVEKYAPVLHYDTNRGKGNALKHGLSHIKNNFREDAVIVTLDADGQHAPSDVGRVLYAAWEHQDSLVLGSRDFAGEVPVKSRFGNDVTRMVFAAATGRKLQDTQTGLRAFSYAMIDRLLAIDGDRYEYEMNVLMDFAKTATPIREVPIETIYSNNNASSHFDAIRDSFRIYREIFRYSAASFASFLLDYGLFAFLSGLLATLTAVNAVVLANVLARLCSGTFNYFLNRRLVFSHNGSMRTSAFRYLLLATGILFINTGLLHILADIVGVHPYLAKIIVETGLFFVSYLVQRTFVFAKEESWKSMGWKGIKTYEKI